MGSIEWSTPSMNTISKLALDPRLGEFVSVADFAKMIGKSKRTVSRLIHQPDGLPHLPFGNAMLISIPDAKAWFAGRTMQPNPRR
jgi:hypothetical protein